jgi:hypothetical protein
MMTSRFPLLFPVRKTCAICGREGEQQMIALAEPVGTPDLDSRPPETLRSTLCTWVERCDVCGYCAPDIEEGVPDADRIAQVSALIRTAEYRERLNAENMPALANSFLCHALLQEDAGAWGAAAWGMIHAAWACDDAGMASAARECRKMAARAVLRAQQRGRRIATLHEVEFLILVDLLRRSEQFDHALSLCEDGQQRLSDKTAVQVLRFQAMLSKKRDTACYSLAQATGNG